MNEISAAFALDSLLKFNKIDMNELTNNFSLPEISLNSLYGIS